MNETPTETDDAETIAALHERVAELEARIETLEARIDAGDTDTADTGEALDHRDRSVLAHMRENGKVSRISLVRLYLAITDIKDRSTAKRRAKQLERTDAYNEL